MSSGYEIMLAYANCEDVLPIYEEALQMAEFRGQSLDGELLEIAASYNDSLALEFLHNKNLDLGYVDNQGNNLLFYSATLKLTDGHYEPSRNSMEDTYSLFNSHGISIKSINNQGESLVDASVIGGNPVILHYCSLEGVPFDSTDFDDNNLIHQLIKSYQRNGYKREKDYLDSLIILLNQNVDIDEENDDNESPLQYASRLRLINFLDIMNPEDTSLAGGLSLFDACINSDIGSVQKLVRLEQNINSAYNGNEAKFQGMQLLGISVTNLDLEISEVLIDYADVLSRDNNDSHPLAYLLSINASLATNLKTYENKVIERYIDLFTFRGWDINSIIDKDENSLLSKSLLHYDEFGRMNNFSLGKTVALHLIRKNVDANHINKFGNTLLSIVAMVEGKIEDNVIEYIIGNTKNFEHRNRDSETVLHILARNTKSKNIKKIIKLLGDRVQYLIDIKNNNGKTPLEISILEGNEKLSKLLISNLQQP